MSAICSATHVSALRDPKWRQVAALQKRARVIARPRSRGCVLECGDLAPLSKNLKVLPILLTFILLVASVFLLAASPLAAASLEKDLGEGLTYFRAHVLPEDLPAAAVKPGPIVLDLRFVTSHENGENALDAWLKFRATARTPVFVLVDPQTAEHFAPVLAAHQSSPGFLTIGEATEEFTPDIAVDAPLEEEKKAYDALEQGASISSLTTENADKVRNDEAALTHAHTNLEEDPSESDFVEAEPPKVDKTKAPLPVPQPVIDRTLQRAIHVHRGLLALKRLERPKA